MKIAICGRMAAGKTTLANLIINGVNNDVVKLSMAGQVTMLLRKPMNMTTLKPFGLLTMCDLLTKQPS